MHNRNFHNSLASDYKEPIKCVSLNNQPWKAKPTLVNINFNETILYPFTVSVAKFGGSHNTTDDPYARLCVPSKVKNMNVKII